MVGVAILEPRREHDLRPAAAIEARDRYYGSMIGTSAGEPLRSPSTPGLIDPVRHFRDNPFPEAHAFEPLVP